MSILATTEGCPYLPTAERGRSEGPLGRLIQAVNRVRRDCVLRKVERDCFQLRKVSVIFRDDEGVVLAALRNDGCTLQDASSRLKGDKRLVLEAIRNWNPEIHHPYGYQNPFASASDALKDDFEVVEAAFLKDPHSLQFASKRTVLEIVRRNGLALVYASTEHQKDEEICQAAYQNNPRALQYADTGFVHATVLWDGLALQYACSNHRNDRRIVQAAFEGYNLALQFASMGVIHELLQENGLLLQFVSEEHRNTPLLVRAAVGQNGLGLQFASEAMRQDLQVGYMAVRQNREARQYASPLFRQEPSFEDSYSEDDFVEVADFDVNTADISADPLQVLRDLYPNMANGFPKIKYVGSDGEDGGGLSRDFVSRMMRAVFDLEKMHLPFEVEGGKIIPLIQDGNRNQIGAYQAIGAILGIALEKFPRFIERDLAFPLDIVTGNYFQPLFFEMIHSLSGDEIGALPAISKYEDVPEEVVDKLFRIYARTELKYTEVEIEEILKGLIPERFEEYYSEKGDFFTSKFKQIVLGATIISKSMYKHLRNPGDWDPIKGGDAAGFAKAIEGELTREVVLGALNWENEHQVTQCYLIDWINECSPEELEKFVFAMTGSKTLAPNQKLNFRLYPSDSRLPSYHTCFFKMDLPNGYPTYDLFKTKLEQSLGSAEGFQTL